jgi:aspartate aminotransferase
MGSATTRPETDSVNRRKLYLLVKAPIDDDVEFARRLRKDKLLVLPGRTVDMPGYFRISLTATDDMIDRALPAFGAARHSNAPSHRPGGTLRVSAGC